MNIKIFLVCLIVKIHSKKPQQSLSKIFDVSFDTKWLITFQMLENVDLHELKDQQDHDDDHHDDHEEKVSFVDQKKLANQLKMQQKMRTMRRKKLESRLKAGFTHVSDRRYQGLCSGQGFD